MSRLISNSLRTTKNPFLLTCHYNHNNVLLNEVTIKTLHSRYGNQLNARVVALRCYHPKLNQNLLNQKTTLVSSQYNNNRSLHTTNCLWESSTKNSTSPTTSTTTAAAATPAPSNTAAAAAATSTTSTTANIYERTKNRGPVSWPSLLLVGVAAASAVAYYQIERERRLEKAMGKIVSSEYNNDKDDGWTPRPDYLAKRKFIPTKFGWFPMADGFGAREFFYLFVVLFCLLLILFYFLYLFYVLIVKKFIYDASSAAQALLFFASFVRLYLTNRFVFSLICCRYLSSSFLLHNNN